jgi:hypothetical protein
MSLVQRITVLLGSAGVVVGTSAMGALVAEPATSDEVRAVVAEMLADAETRSSLLAGADGGHDGKNFFLGGEGYSLNVYGMMQFRYLANFRDDDNIDDFEPGFQTRRTRLGFKGAIEENWLFNILSQFNRKEGGELQLLDAYAAHKFANGVVVGWGQLKAPIVREDWIVDSNQLAIERAPTTDFFRPDRVQAVWVQYEAEEWRTWVTFNDGAASLNTDFTDDPADYAFSGRFEFKFAGEWKQFDDFTSKQGEPFGAMAGVAAHFQESPNTNDPADVDVEFLLYTADVTLQGDGWNAFASFVGTYAEIDSFAGDTERDEFGVVVQGGVYVAEKTELFARWDSTFLDDEARSISEDNFNFITAGVNHYFAGQAAKFTLDGVYSLDETTDFVSSGGLGTGQGLLGDSEDGEFVLRAQFQLLF